MSTTTFIEIGVCMHTVAIHAVHIADPLWSSYYEIKLYRTFWSIIKADLDGTTFAYNCHMQLAYNSIVSKL